MILLLQDLVHAAGDNEMTTGDQMRAKGLDRRGGNDLIASGRHQQDRLAQMRRIGRPRKLLLHRKEINKLIGAVQQQGMTIVPLRLYFNERGIAKLQLALARGKKHHDKRETEKKRDWQRDKARLLREKG